MPGASERAHLCLPNVCQYLYCQLQLFSPLQLCHKLLKGSMVPSRLQGAASMAQLLPAVVPDQQLQGRPPVAHLCAKQLLM